MLRNLHQSSVFCHPISRDFLLHFLLTPLFGTAEKLQSSSRSGPTTEFLFGLFDPAPKAHTLPCSAGQRIPVALVLLFVFNKAVTLEYA